MNQTNSKFTLLKFVWEKNTSLGWLSCHSPGLVPLSCSDDLETHTWVLLPFISHSEH